MKELEDYYSGEHERVGFILEDGTIVEVVNVSDNPATGFDVRAEDLIDYSDVMVATWHTHPDAPANLSEGDYESFMMWPHLDHFIIGNDGVRRYQIKNGVLINA